MTTAGQPYPFRVACTFAGKRGHVVLDELRTVDRERLRKPLGIVAAETTPEVLRVLGEMFES